MTNTYAIGDTHTALFQIRKFLDAYTREQLLIITDDELRSSPVETMRKVFGHVGMPPMDVEPLDAEAISRMFGNLALSLILTLWIALLTPFFCVELPMCIPHSRRPRDGVLRESMSPCLQRCVLFV